MNEKKVALVLLMLALSFRVLKSVFYFLLYPKLSIWFLMMGFLGFSMIGPLTYVYFKSKAEHDLVSTIKKQWLNLAFPVIGVLVLYLFPDYAEALYFLCLISMGFYLALAYWVFRRKKVKEKNDEQKWDAKLFIALTVLFATFLMPYVVVFSMAYAIGTAMASLTIFVLFFYFLKYAPKLAKNKVKYRVGDKHKQRIISALEMDAVYRDPSIKLNTFSEQLNIPQYIILQVTKDKYGKSFHGTINSLRIKDAKKRLKDKLSDVKIETLAYDIGFNTVSAFYTVFKKETSMSPREYQRMVSSEDSN